MLYIIPQPTDPIVDYVLKPLEGIDGIEFMRFKKNKPHGIRAITRPLRTYVFNKKGLWADCFFDKEFLNQITRIREDDTVLIFAVKNIKELTVIHKEINCGNIYTFLWDPMSSVESNSFNRNLFCQMAKFHKMNIVTFDEGDSKRFGFAKVPQVYRMPNDVATPHHSQSYDVSFIAKDKGRIQEIVKLQDLLSKHNISHFFYVLKDCKSNEQYNKYLKTEFLDYSKITSIVASSKAILEIVQPGQIGFTLRCLEALFYEKKLISNNPYLKQTDIYHANNILIIDKNTQAEDIKNFLSTPYHVWDREHIEKYEISNWIKQFKKSSM